MTHLLAVDIVVQTPSLSFKQFYAGNFRSHGANFTLIDMISSLGLKAMEENFKSYNTSKLRPGYDENWNKHDGIPRTLMYCTVSWSEI